MLPLAESVGVGAGRPLPRLVILDDEAGFFDQIEGALSARGYRASRVGSVHEVEGLSGRDRPDLMIVSDRRTEAGKPADRFEAIARLGVPVLAVTDDASDPDALADRLAGPDDWVTRDALIPELPARVARLLNRPPPTHGRGPSKLPADPHFFAMLVHDLRTPLNVVGLSLRMISKALPEGDPEIQEDLRFVEDNFRQIEKMLTLLSDFIRLFESDLRIGPTPFDPRRMIDELLEATATKAGARRDRVLVEPHESCPAEVALDPLRARMALQYALANAATAAGDVPIRLRMTGAPDRWIIEVAVDRPPPPSVKPVVLTAHAFERLCGQHAERRGLDLAIAAKISEMFGGTARLEVAQNDGTAVVLDWPARLPEL